jgi:hypothetical protein
LVAFILQTSARHFPSPSAREVYSPAQKFEASLFRNFANVERPQQISIVCDDLNFVTGTARILIARPQMRFISLEILKHQIN